MTNQMIADFYDFAAAREYWLAAQADRLAAQNALRPSVFLRVDVSRAMNDMWVASYCGVFASGDSPAEACDEFDRVWLGVN